MLFRLFSLLLLLGFYSQLGIAQDSISIDMLRSPSSPAFSVLGVNPTTIEEPTTPTDLLLSIKNATESFSAFPTAYSLDFAPGWVFGGKKITYEDFKSDKFGDALKQNSTISVATNKKETQVGGITNQIGLGIKLSLDRGKFDEEYEAYKMQSDSIYGALSDVIDMDGEIMKTAIAACGKCVEQETLINSLRDKLKNEQSTMTAQEKQDLIKRISDQVNIQDAYLKELNQSVSNKLESQAQTQIAILKNAAENLKFNRSGFKLDFAAGVAFDFADQKIENGTVGNYGAWLTGGNEWKSKGNSNTFSLLGTTRLLLYPDEKYQFGTDTLTSNNLRFDAGLRLIYKTANKKLSISAEILNRAVVNNSDIPNTYKASFNLDYAILKNKTITLSLGRNFDGTFEDDGNLIAAINFIAGFGSKRPF